MQPLAFLVLRELSDGEFHSKEQLARTLNVNQSCITHSLDDIQHYGIVLQTTYDDDCRWHNPIVWINKSEIIEYLHKDKQVFQFEILNSVDSTNRYLLELSITDFTYSQKNPVIITELQTQGRGRFGRQWFSGLGDSVTFSLYWRFKRSINQLSGLSLVVGVAIVRALSKYNINDISLKWPNDVLFCFRKLAGILIESNNDIRAGSFVVIGIGLNVQLSSLTKQNIDQSFVDLYSIIGHSINRNKLVAVLLSELVTVLNAFNHFGFIYFRKEWINYHAFEGKLISLRLPDGTVKEGVADGVECDGSIRLKLTTGEIRSFSSGELTSR